jgi:hypothetical protein
MAKLTTSGGRLVMVRGTKASSSAAVVNEVVSERLKL